MARPRNIEREEREALRAGPDEGLYATWKAGDHRGRARAMRGQPGEDGLVRRSTAGYDVGGGVTVRQGVDRRDYLGFRPGEGRPSKPRDRILACMKAYDEFGIVRNIIDTMSDFAVQGVNLVHPNPRIEAWFQNWFAKVAGPDVSEHIANTLFLCANAPVRRHTAKLRQPDVDAIQRGTAADRLPREPEPARREVPYAYTVMNPVQVVVQGGDLVPFMGPGSFSYAVEVPATLASQINRPKTQAERELVARLPEAVRRAIKAGNNTIPLSSEQMRVLYYKRRHWQVWATPMTYPLLDDLNMLRKLKLADLTALDSAISHVRIWKLGSLKDRMMPTRKAIQKLADMLANAGSGVGIDIIWGPDLELVETSTDVHHFLGEGKYAPHLAAVFAGYGIPATLVGAAVQGGMTNNFISLKTLTERLQYVRRLVREFWEFEASIVQQAMNFRLAPTVRFDRMVLTDEAAEKALLVQLADRDLISVETLQERFGEDPLIEAVRQRREDRAREKGKRAPKAGAFHNPQAKLDLMKQFVQTQTVTPRQAGLELPPKAPGEKTPMDHQADNQMKQQRQQQKAQVQQQEHDLKVQKLQLKHGVHPGQLEKDAAAGPGKKGATPGKQPGRKAPAVKRPGQPQQGRPRNSKDTQKRKKKQVKVRTGAKAELARALDWAQAGVRAVRKAAMPAYLSSCGRGRQAELTRPEAEAFERLRLAVLVNLPDGRPTARVAAEALQRPLDVPSHVSELYEATLRKYQRKSGKKPSRAKLREFVARVAALYRAEVYGSG